MSIDRKKINKKIILKQFFEIFENLVNKLILASIFQIFLQRNPKTTLLKRNFNMSIDRKKINKKIILKQFFEIFENLVKKLILASIFQIFLQRNPKTTLLKRFL